MRKQDLDLDVMAPHEVSLALRRAADTYRQSHMDLVSAWQDPCAGLIWEKLADTLEAAANACDKKCERWLP